MRSSSAAARRITRTRRSIRSRRRCASRGSSTRRPIRSRGSKRSCARVRSVALRGVAGAPRIARRRPAEVRAADGGRGLDSAAPAPADVSAPRRDPTARGDAAAGALHRRRLHWVNPSTLELIDVLFEGARGAAVLLLLTARPEVIWSLDGRPDAFALDLPRLGREHTAELLRHVAGGTKLSSDIAARLAERTEGYPSSSRSSPAPSSSRRRSRATRSR